MRLFLIGINSFIGKNFYLKLRTSGYPYPITCLNHTEIEFLNSATDEDIVINFCGINRSEKEEDYMLGNFHFLQNIIKKLNKESLPYFVHHSSYMVHGFVNKKIEDLGGYSRIFIETKLKGENFLVENYPKSKLAIIRPSNIYGYNCEPYYNNILVSMIYENIIQEYKINKINKNCIRNFLSIEGLVDKLVNIIKNKNVGIFNIISNNDVSLDKLVTSIHDEIPENFKIDDGEISIPNVNIMGGINLIINENLKKKVGETKEKMKLLLEIKMLSPIKTLNRLSQPRGDMVEISDLNSKRLYMITITENSFRGNHFHYEQIEHFYVNSGKVGFLLAHEKNPDVIFFKVLKKYDSVKVNPYIIHTLVNDFKGKDPEVFVTSTQEFIPNSAPDTKYINIIPFI